MMIGAALLGYAVLPSDPGLWFAVALAFLLAMFAVRALLRLRRRRSPQNWQETPAGFVVHPVRFGAVPPWLLLTGGLLPAAASMGAALREHGWSERLLPAPVLVFFVVYAVRMLRRHRGPITVSSSGVALGSRLFAWEDVQLAYLHFDLVEVRTRSAILCIDGTAYDVPAAEIHWLIQHYLLFPAKRDTMATLPTRAYARPA